MGFFNGLPISREKAVVGFWHLHWGESKTMYTCPIPKFCRVFCVVMLLLLGILPLVQGQVYSFGLALQWAPSVCLFASPTGCRSAFSQADEFYIHGLWASDKSGVPLLCTRFNTPKPVPSTLLFTTPTGLRQQQLQLLWPNLMSKGTMVSFWKYEYMKHGICFMASSNDYLSKAITAYSDVMTEMNLNGGSSLYNDLLLPLGFVAGSVVDLLDLSSKIQQNSHGNVDVDMRCHQTSTQDILLEIVFCVKDVSFVLVHCPGTRFSSCADPSLVLFPSFHPSPPPPPPPPPSPPPPPPSLTQPPPPQFSLPPPAALHLTSLRHLLPRLLHHLPDVLGLLSAVFRFLPPAVQNPVLRLIGVVPPLALPAPPALPPRRRLAFVVLLSVLVLVLLSVLVLVFAQFAATL